MGRCTECPVSTSAPSVLKRELWHDVHAYYRDSQNILSTSRHLSNIFIKHSHFIVSAEVKVKCFVPAASCGSKKRVCLWNPSLCYPLCPQNGLSHITPAGGSSTNGELADPWEAKGVISMQGGLWSPIKFLPF